MASPLAMDITDLDPAAASIVGDRVACAAYGLPGTKKLKKGVAVALAGSKGKAFLLAYHGALCLGKDYDEAFTVASTLEQVCADFVSRRYLQVSCRENLDYDELREYFVGMVSRNAAANSNSPPKSFFNSERTGDCFRLYMNATAEKPFPWNDHAVRLVKITERPVPGERKICRQRRRFTVKFTGDLKRLMRSYTLFLPILSLFPVQAKPPIPCWMTLRNSSAQCKYGRLQRLAEFGERNSQKAKMTERGTD